MATVTEGRKYGYSIEEWIKLTDMQRVIVMRDYETALGYGVETPTQDIMRELLHVKPPEAVKSSSLKQEEKLKPLSNFRLEFKIPNELKLNKINNTHDTMMQTSKTNTTHVHTPSTQPSTIPASLVPPLKYMPLPKSQQLPQHFKNNRNKDQFKSAPNARPTPHTQHTTYLNHNQYMDLSPYVQRAIRAESPDLHPYEMKSEKDIGQTYSKDRNYPTPVSTSDEETSPTPSNNKGKTRLGSVTPVSQPATLNTIPVNSTLVNYDKLLSKSEFSDPSVHSSEDPADTPGIKRRKLGDKLSIKTKTSKKCDYITKVPTSAGGDTSKGNEKHGNSQDKGSEKRKDSDEKDSDKHNTNDNGNNGSNGNSGGSSGNNNNNGNSGNGDRGDRDKDKDKDDGKEKRNQDDDDANDGDDEDDQDEDDENDSIGNMGQSDRPRVRRRKRFQSQGFPSDTEMDENNGNNNNNNNNNRNDRYIGDELGYHQIGDDEGFSDYPDILKEDSPDYQDPRECKLRITKLREELDDWYMSTKALEADLRTARRNLNAKNDRLNDVYRKMHEQTYSLADKYASSLEQVVAVVKYGNNNNDNSNSNSKRTDTDRLAFELRKSQVKKILEMELDKFGKSKPFRGTLARETGEFID